MANYDSGNCCYSVPSGPVRSFDGSFSVNGSFRGSSPVMSAAEQALADAERLLEEAAREEQRSREEAAREQQRLREEEEQRLLEEEERKIPTITKTIRGKLIAITGDFNKGKTWLVDKLTYVPEDPNEVGTTTLPEGFQLSTPGLCAKRVQINGAYLVFVDTAGKNQSITMSDSVEFDGAFKEEHLQRSLLSELCPNILFVIGKMTRTEQKTMWEICESLKRLRSQRKITPKLFVVHNWKEVTEKPLFESAVEEVCSLLGVSDNVSGEVARVSRSPGTTFCFFEMGIVDPCIDEAARSAKLKHAYADCLKRKDAETADKKKLQLQECNVTIRQGIVTKSVGHYVHLQWESGANEICDHDKFLELCRDEVIVQTCPESQGFVLEDRRVCFRGDQYTVPIVSGQFDEIDVSHVFLANDHDCSFGQTYNGCAFPVIRALLQEAAAFTTSPGLDMGFLNYMTEFKSAMERVAPRFFKTEQGLKQGKAKDFRMRMQQAIHNRPTNHIQAFLGLDAQKASDSTCRLKLLEECPEMFYDIVIRPYPTKDFRHFPGHGVELRLNKNIMADQSENAVNVFRLSLTPFAHFLPDLNPRELSLNPTSAISSHNGLARFITINGCLCKYRILMTTEIPECSASKAARRRKVNADNAIQRKRVIIDVPGCVDLAQSVKFDDQSLNIAKNASGGKRGPAQCNYVGGDVQSVFKFENRNVKVANDVKKSNDVHFKFGGGGTIEVRSKNLKQHDFVALSDKWTDVTLDEGQEVRSSEKGNLFNIGFGIDSAKTKIVQDRGLLIIDVVSKHDDHDDEESTSDDEAI